MQITTSVGIVIKVIDNHNFHVKLKDGTILLTSISSKVNYVFKKDIAMNDEVAIQFSPYDTARGRIIYKHPIMKQYFKTKK